jgi:hypothetical protein
MANTFRLFIAIFKAVQKIMQLSYEERTATDYGLDDPGVGVRVPVGSSIFSFPRRPYRLWSPHNLLSKGYRGL